MATLTDEQREELKNLSQILQAEAALQNSLAILDIKAACLEICRAIEMLRRATYSGNAEMNAPIIEPLKKACTLLGYPTEQKTVEK